MAIPAWEKSFLYNYLRYLLMANYFAVYNNQNKIVLNDTYKNLYLSRKIQLTGTGTFTGSFSNGEIIAAVGGTTSKSIDAYCQNTGSGYVCVVNTFVSGMSIYIFTTNRPNRNSGIGLQLFNSSGNVIFDSLDPHPKVTAFGNTTGIVNVGNKPAIAVAPNITYLTNTLSVSYDSERYAIAEWFPDEYGWEWVDNPPGTIPQREYKYVVVNPAHWENVWHTKYKGFSYLTTKKDYKNFKLSGASIEEVIVSSTSTTVQQDYYEQDDSDREVFEWGRARMELFARSDGITYKTIIKTQSFLLLDVDGL